MNTKAKLIAISVFAIIFSLGTIYVFQHATRDFYDLADYDPNAEYFPTQKWGRLAQSEIAGWSPQELLEIEHNVKNLGSDAMVIVDNGVVILALGEYQEPYRLHSVRKALMSAMYGIFVDNGDISLSNTLTQLNIDDIDGLTDLEKSATVRDLLMSKSGIYHPAAYETKSMEKTRPERGSHLPGTFWYYNNWDFNVLVTIFNQETKHDFFHAFEKHLAQPLQMEHFSINDTEYRFDDDSIHPAYLFRMTALDLARVGLLYLREGRWNEQQLIPRNWIQMSTSPLTVLDNSPLVAWGFCWKVRDGYYYAAGTGGQRLFIHPGQNLVVVHRVDTDKDKHVPSKAIRDLLDVIILAAKD